MSSRRWTDNSWTGCSQLLMVCSDNTGVTQHIPNLPHIVVYTMTHDYVRYSTTFTTYTCISDCCIRVYCDTALSGIFHYIQHTYNLTAVYMWTMTQHYVGYSTTFNTCVLCRLFAHVNVMQNNTVVSYFSAICHYIQYIVLCILCSTHDSVEYHNSTHSVVY